jgi:hypothetical protein
MPGRSKVKNQKKRGWVWGMRLTNLVPLKKNSLLRSLMDSRWIILVIWERKIKRWQMKAVERRRNGNCN